MKSTSLVPSTGAGRAVTPAAGNGRSMAQVSAPTRSEVFRRTLTSGPLAVLSLTGTGTVGASALMTSATGVECVGALAAAVLAAAIYPCVRGARRELLAERREARAELVTKARDALENNLEHLLLPVRSGERAERTVEGAGIRRDAKALLHDADATAECNDLAMRIAALKRYRDDALKEIGTEGGATSDDICEHAAAAARTLYAEIRRIVEVKKAQHRSHATETGPLVAAEFMRKVRGLVGDVPLATRTPPSTSAAAARLIAVAEQALAHDPDLADAAGARVDDLVRVHLPRLLRRHGEAAGAAASTDLARVDADLAEGVEQARASIDEALSGDAERRFEALREEVAFLRARRAATDGAGAI